MRRYLPSAPAVTLHYGTHVKLSHVFEVTRRGGAYTVHYNRGPDGYDVTTATWRIGAAIYWLEGVDGDFERLTFDLSDGQMPGDITFRPSSNDPAAVLLPDGQFFEHRGFEEIRDMAPSHSRRWEERSARLVWRGSNTGEGVLPGDDPDPFDPALPQRLRMVLLMRGCPDADVAFSANVREPEWDAPMERLGLLGGFIDQPEWGASKFALNVDGNSNAWINPLAKMHLGCCLINVESDRGYRQWWHERWRPWEHYVPVRPDMSDLLEKVAWARENDAEAGRIAASGTALARSITFEGETAWAARRIAGVIGAPLRPGRGAGG